MALPARFSLLHSDLNEFLFASVGTEENGAPISILSALTRLGVDPWEEADRLARLPRVHAAAALAALIARLPVERVAAPGSVDTMTRLVERLPRAAAGREPPGTIAKKQIDLWVWLACLGLAGMAFWALL